jgi:hypothetical protein
MAYDSAGAFAFAADLCYIMDDVKCCVSKERTRDRFIVIYTSFESRNKP